MPLLVAVQIDAIGFNPCCSGSALQTQAAQTELQDADGAVSIPVVVDQLFRPAAADRDGSALDARFQSLL